MDGGDDGVGLDPLPGFGDDGPHPSLRRVDAGHPGADPQLPAQRGQAGDEGVGEPLRPSGGVPLAEQVVGGLPPGEDRPAGHARPHGRVGGEGGHRAPGEVGGQPPPQQRVVGPEGVADGAEGVPTQRPEAGGHPSGNVGGRQLSLHRRQHRPYRRYRPLHEGGVGPGLVRARLGDRVDGVVDRAEEADPAAIGVHGHRERVHLLVDEAGPGQVELGRDAGHVQDVVGDGVGVEAGTRRRFPPSGTRLPGGRGPPGRLRRGPPGPDNRPPPARCGPLRRRPRHGEPPTQYRRGSSRGPSERAVGYR